MGIRVSSGWQVVRLDNAVPMSLEPPRHCKSCGATRAIVTARRAQARGTANGPQLHRYIKRWHVRDEVNVLRACSWNYGVKDLGMGVKKYHLSSIIKRYVAQPFKG